MKNMDDLYNWHKMLGHKLYLLNIPINKVVKYIKKYINRNNSNSKVDYIWKYDTQFGKCDCIPDNGALSNPYCKHYNKLVREIKNET